MTEDRTADDRPTEVVLVTGSARGIGRGIAQRIATPERGVVINYLAAQEAAEAAVKNIHAQGGHSFSVKADVSDPESVAAMADKIRSKWGRVSAIVHNSSPPVNHSRIEDTPWHEFESHWAVQVKGAFNLVQEFIPDLRDSSGQLIFILSSFVLQQPPVQQSAYVTTKYGLLGFARSVGAELIKTSVRVNMVSPYVTETEISPDIPSRAFELWAGAHPMGRLTTVEDTAHVVEFLLSPNASYLNMVNIPVTGGIVS